MNNINMKIVNINGEVVLAAADSELINRDLREGKLHLKVKQDFYGDMRVSEDTFYHPSPYARLQTWSEKGL